MSLSDFCFLDLMTVILYPVAEAMRPSHGAALSSLQENQKKPKIQAHIEQQMKICI